jgi:multiple sugar transport system ATP-binding protein
MADVRVEHLTKRFGDVVAVDDISLEIHDGTFMVFLGPSGCGKTTTLRAIAGLESADKGDIYIGPRRVNRLSPAQRDIAFVFQFYALYPHLSAFDNIAFPLKAQHVRRNDQEQRVHAIARVLRIEHLLPRRINQLSSGEQQRVALGRAMIREPQVMLMDEPLTNLDAQLRGDMRAELKHLQHERQVTTVYVTHDQVEAMAMADQITVMHAGKIMQVGPPMEIYDHPANLYVAGFVGSPPMNFISGEWVDGIFQSPGMTMQLNGSIGQKIEQRARGRNVIVGVRPEDVHVGPVNQSASGAASAKVFIVEPLGDETLIDLKLGDSQLRARAAPTTPWREGDVVSLSLDSGRLHVFDAQTEEVLT